MFNDSVLHINTLRGWGDKMDKEEKQENNNTIGTSGNILISDFSPKLQSEQVIIESKLYGDYEAHLNYEFPHPELRDSMKEELLGKV